MGYVLAADMAELFGEDGGMANKWKRQGIERQANLLYLTLALIC